MIMPMKPSIEPTDRSMLRVTMTSTMPVAMMATEAICTDRFHRLRGVRKQAARQDVEADPDQQQRADHAEHAGVDLRGLEEEGEPKARGLAAHG